VDSRVHVWSHDRLYGRSGNCVYHEKQCVTHATAACTLAAGRLGLWEVEHNSSAGGVLLADGCKLSKWVVGQLHTVSTGLSHCA
jgi:hypothetical protein